MPARRRRWAKNIPEQIRAYRVNGRQKSRRLRIALRLSNTTALNPSPLPPNGHCPKGSGAGMLGPCSTVHLEWNRSDHHKETTYARCSRSDRERVGRVHLRNASARCSFSLQMRARRHRITSFLVRRTGRQFIPNFCAALCQFCAVDFLRAVGNPSRNFANPLGNNGFRSNRMRMIRKE